MAVDEMTVDPPSPRNPEQPIQARLDESFTAVRSSVGGCSARLNGPMLS